MTIRYKLDKQLKVVEGFKNPVIIEVHEFTTEAVSKFRADINLAMESDQEVIPILIDSPGGAVHCLKAMIDIINSCPKTIATIGTGHSMSCGAILLTCGTKGYRYSTENNTILLHDISNSVWGKIEELKSTLEHSKEVSEWAFNLLDKNCGKKAGYFKKKFEEKHHADWYLSAEEGLEHGLIDKIGLPHFTVKTKLSVEFED